MSTVCVFILTFSTLCGSRGASGVLSGPSNVRLTSYNMNLVLKWEPPDGAFRDLVYTAEFRSSISSVYSKGCVNISSNDCDLTKNGGPILEYGIYVGRVRAQSGPETSPWAETSNCTMDKDTIIGPPGVSLAPVRASIEVSIEDPLLAVSSLRRVYTDISYNVTYWKDGQRETAKRLSKIHQNRIVMDELDPLTKYCFLVHINKPWKPAEPSATVCERTGKEEETQWVAALVTFVVIAIAATVVGLAVAYQRSIYNFLCPKDSLPEHLKEYLLEPPSSSIYKAMQRPQPDEIVADVTVVEGGPLEGTASPCSRPPDGHSGRAEASTRET